MALSCPACKADVLDDGVRPILHVWCPSCRTVWLRTDPKRATGTAVAGPKTGQKLSLPKGTR